MLNRSTLFFYFLFVHLGPALGMVQWYRDCQVYNNFNSDFRLISSAKMNLFSLGKDKQFVDGSLYQNYADSSDQNLYYLYSKAIQKKNIAKIGEYFEHNITPKARTILPFYVDCVVRSLGIVEEAGILQEYIKPFAIATQDRKLTLEYTLLKMKEVLQSLEVLFRNGFYYVGLSSGQIGISQMEIREEFANLVGRKKPDDEVDALKEQIISTMNMAIKKKMRGGQNHMMEAGKKVFVSRGKVRFIHRIASKCRPESFKHLGVYLERYRDVKDQLGSNVQKIKTDYDFCVKMDLFEYLLALEKFLNMSGSQNFNFKTVLVVIEALLIEQQVGDIASAEFTKELYEGDEGDEGEPSSGSLMISEDSAELVEASEEDKAQLVEELLARVKESLAKDEVVADERVLRFFIRYRYYRRELLEFIFTMHHIKQKYARRFILMMVEDLLRFVKGEELIFDGNVDHFREVSNEFIYLRFLNYAGSEHDHTSTKKSLKVDELIRRKSKKLKSDMDEELIADEHVYDSSFNKGKNKDLFEMKSLSQEDDSALRQVKSMVEVGHTDMRLKSKGNLHNSLNLKNQQADFAKMFTKLEQKGHDDSSQSSSQTSSHKSIASPKDHLKSQISREISSQVSHLRSAKDSPKLQDVRTHENRSGVSGHTQSMRSRESSHKSTLSREKQSSHKSTLSREEQSSQSPKLNAKDRSVVSESRNSSMRSKGRRSVIQKTHETSMQSSVAKSQTIKRDVVSNHSREKSRSQVSGTERSPSQSQRQSMKNDVHVRSRISRDNESMQSPERTREQKTWAIKSNKTSLKSTSEMTSTRQSQRLKQGSQPSNDLKDVEAQSHRMGSRHSATIKQNSIRTSEMTSQNSQRTPQRTQSRVSKSRVTADLSEQSRSTRDEHRTSLNQSAKQRQSETTSSPQKSSQSRGSRSHKSVVSGQSRRSPETKKQVASMDSEAEINMTMKRGIVTRKDSLVTKVLTQSKEETFQQSLKGAEKTYEQMDKKPNKVNDILGENETHSKLKGKLSSAIQLSQTEQQRPAQSTKSLSHVSDSNESPRTRQQKITIDSDPATLRQSSQKDRDDDVSSPSNRLESQSSRRSDEQSPKLLKQSTDLVERMKRAKKTTYIKNKKRNHKLYKKIITNFNPKEPRDEENFEYITEHSRQFDDSVGEEIEIEKITAVPKTLN